jgi:hypothetical protein
MKSELIAKLAANRDEFLNLVASVSEAQRATIPVVGEWTIKDAVGHVSYWEQVIHDNLREAIREGKPHAQTRDELDDIANPREAAKRKDWSWMRVRAEFEDTRNGLIAHIESLTEIELAAMVPNPWWGEQCFYSVGEMIESDAIGHTREHLKQIQHWQTAAK